MSGMKFEFSRHAMDVEIDGAAYSVDCSAAAQAFILEQNQKLNRLIEDIKHGEKTEAAAIDLLRATFDRILGEGAVDSIFSDRAMCADDLADLSLFIRDVYARYNSDVQRRIAGQPQM